MTSVYLRSARCLPPSRACEQVILRRSENFRDKLTTFLYPAPKIEHSQVPRPSPKQVVYPAVETYNFRDKREIKSKAHSRGGQKSKEPAYPRQIKDEVRIPKPPLVIRADVRTAPGVRRVPNRSLVALNQATPSSPPARQSSSQRLLPREPPKKAPAKQPPDTPRTHLPRIKLLQRNEPAEEDSEVSEDEGKD
ncbi:hypothetical protein CYMTET_13635 [Cymbomonas tetramitiformis]|uniref:Uncharacterized protein n=1 Tax=Cymbomonas tetramitiformis TaxID=36881 RepID=A0AAE0GI00_9CHLO|nr:hypothetical protein CYMTET_13635 [Cymbomonas tetramitiformis]